jgi:hypothetical protein
MRLFAIAALTVATFVSTLLVGHTQANAVVCARGVYRAGCVGPHGAVVVHRHHYYRYRRY